MNTTSNISGKHLLSYLERLSSLQREKKEIAGEISALINEAKGAGFDPRTLTALSKERAMDPATLRERQEMLAEYRDAIGQLEDTPLGRAAAPPAAESPSKVHTIAAAKEAKPKGKPGRPRKEKSGAYVKGSFVQQVQQH
jgi:uncharacterized protein (UPF0335 family)